MNFKNITQFFLDLSFSGLFILFSMKSFVFVFPKGVTVDFLNRGLFLIFFGTLVVITLFFVSWFLSKNFQFKKKFETPELKDFIFIIFPMTPVISYIVLNIEYLNTQGVIYLFLIPSLFSIFYCLIFPALFSYFASLKVIMISGMSICFTILSMPEITQNPSRHLFNSQFVTQGSYLLISFLCLYVLCALNKKIAYIAVIVFFLSGVFQNYLGNFESKNSLVAKPDRLNKFFSNDLNKIIKKYDVYILVYESYANQEMLKNYGFDNSSQLKFLEDNHFQIYKGIYSNASQSLASTSRILEIDGKLSNHGRYYTSGNAFGLEIFKANEYETIGLFTSPYFFGQYPISWDKYYPKEDVTKMGAKTILKGIYNGEFRFDIFEDDYDYGKYLKLKKNFLNSKSKKPLFFYTHNKLPGHSTNSGKCRLNEKKIYFENMQKANIEMKNDIENLIKNNPESIIIITSDHGPQLTKNCYTLRGYEINSITKHDVQDRYGVFLAIHWPKNLLINDFNIEISQDIIPAILGNVTNNNSLFEDLKVERSFFDRYINNVGGVNVNNGIIIGGKGNG